MDIELSVVVPVHNEQDNVAPLIGEIADALRGNTAFEIIFIDDNSADKTLSALKGLKEAYPELRIFAHGVNCGQSSAIRTGALAAKGVLITTLDGDGQNDPADIPKVLSHYKVMIKKGPVGMVSGRRTKRQDSWAKRTASKLGNNIRRFVLRDDATDVGCALKVFSKETYMRLPYFDHMHRYFPALMKREGLPVAFVDVNHRPRLHGQSNYGVLDRLWVSLSELVGVAWLGQRARLPKNPEEF